MSIPLHIIILAAGDGTRMRSAVPKVLHTVAGRPMLQHVLEAAAALDPEAVHLVHNPAHDGVRSACVGRELNWVAQAERLGTGHAVQQAMPAIPDDAQVLVLYGDVPLIRPETLRPLLAADAALAVLTATLPDPSGYGRIVRDPDGKVSAVVEHADASAEQRSIREVNTGVIAAAGEKLRRWLGRLEPTNRQGEYYLTGIFALAAAEGAPIAAVTVEDPWEVQGANDLRQLTALEDRYRAVAAARLMDCGVRIIDPSRIELRGPIEAAGDVLLDVNVVLEGSNRLGRAVSVGAGCVLKDCDLADGTRVHPHSVLEGVRTTGACEIGPFARLRPGTVLEADSKVGNFVEIKKTRLGAGSKASHLSYLGDATIGEGVNIGAGTITCNYDGANKHQTVIGDGAFIGSDTQLVAPVRVGRNAVVGAGSTITRDTPDGELTLSRSKQQTVPGWKRPRKE